MTALRADAPAAGEPSGRAELAEREIRRHLALGSTALYRVLEVRRRTVEVEVVECAGLRPGARFRFMRDHVECMERVDGHVAAASRSERASRS